MLFRIDSEQMSIFPKNPRDLAESIGLDWWAAKKLYDDKWLTFDPEKNLIDTNGKEAEFTFLGSLVAAGCDPPMLKHLLRDLERPYCYDLSRSYYDWSNRYWENLLFHGTPQQIAAKIISSFEDGEDLSSLENIKNYAQEAISRLNDEFEEENFPRDIYVCNPQDPFIEAARQMLWKIAASDLIDTPEKTIVVGKLFNIFQQLPKVTLDVNLSLNLVGPRRMFGDHEIYHFWDIELSEEGDLKISSAGHFYRPSTGGDSFTSMVWEAMPGYEPEISNYLNSLLIVDDADTFENEVVVMNLKSGEYELEVEDRTLEAWCGDEKDLED
ncbi:MAG: hypothetical protein AB1585_16410 [Thermodesulfobacteriota bacterium]